MTQRFVPVISMRPERPAERTFRKLRGADFSRVLLPAEPEPDALDAIVDLFFLAVRWRGAL